MTTSILHLITGKIYDAPLKDRDRDILICWAWAQIFKQRGQKKLREIMLNEIYEKSAVIDEGTAGRGDL